MISPLRVLSLFVVACATISPAPAAPSALLKTDEVTVTQSPAYPEADADESLVWLMHRGGWQHVCLGSRLDIYADDDLLFDTLGGIEKEYELLNDMGGFSFIQDFGNPEEVAEAAMLKGGKFAIVNTVSPIAVSRYGVKDADDMANYLIDRLQISLKYPNSLRTEDGKLIVFFFNIEVLKTPQEWADVLERVRAAAPDEDILFIMQRSVVKTSPEYLKKFGAVFDGLIIWGGRYEDKMRQYQQYHDAMVEIGKEPVVFWGVSNGYFREEKGWLRDPGGTSVLRENLATALSHDFAGIMVESWNDYEEHTAIMPSREHGTAFYDLLSYYEARSTGKHWEAREPGLYLSAPKEILLGETLPLELLALPTAATAPRHVALRLESLDGELIYESQVYEFGAEDAQVVSFEVPTRELVSQRYLVPKLVLDGQVRDTGSWVAVRASRVGDAWWRYVTLADVLPMPADALTIDGVVAGGMLKPGVDSREVAIDTTVADGGLMRLDVFRNREPIIGADFSQNVLADVPEEQRFFIQLDFRSPMMYPGEPSSRSGMLQLSPDSGRWLAAYDRYGRDILVNDSTLAWHQEGDRKGAISACAALTDKDAPLTLNVPALKLRLTFTPAELERESVRHYQVSDHGELRVRTGPMALGFPERLEPGVVDLKERISVDESLGTDYFLLAMDGNNGIGRSLPIYVGEHGPAESYWFWDTLAQARFAGSVDSTRILELCWDFDEGEGMVAHSAPDVEEYQIALGGGFDRAGGFNPDGVPAWGPDGTILFDGGTLAVLPANLVPQGAFSMALRLRLEKQDGDQIVLFCQNRLTLTCLPSGRLELEVRGLGEPSTVLTADAPIDWDSWSEIGIEYDLQTIRLTCNGRTVASAPASGLWEGLAPVLIIGQQADGDQIWKYESGMKGAIDSLCFTYGLVAEVE